MASKSWERFIGQPVKKLRRRVERWWARRRYGVLYAIFILSFAIAGVVLLASFAYPSFHLVASDRVVLFVGLLTGAIIWWQGHLIGRQMELKTAVDLYAEWNSKQMRRTRSRAWLDDKPNPDKIEAVLEFLEKVSTFEKEGFISLGLIWDTFGWYLWRYYFYCRDVIMEKRRDWTLPELEPDPTLYQDLAQLFPKLWRMEAAERNYRQSRDKVLSENDMVRELEETKIKFIACERSESDD